MMTEVSFLELSTNSLKVGKRDNTLHQHIKITLFQNPDLSRGGNRKSFVTMTQSITIAFEVDLMFNTRTKGKE